MCYILYFDFGGGNTNATALRLSGEHVCSSRSSEDDDGSTQGIFVQFSIVITTIYNIFSFGMHESLKNVCMELTSQLTEDKVTY